LLKHLPADATVVGIVRNILKLIQTFGNNSHNLYFVSKFSNSKGFSSDFPKLALCSLQLKNWFDWSQNALFAVPKIHSCSC